MILNVNTGERLTWDPAFPAPYESGWSIFAKLAALNHINAKEIVSLIKHDHVAMSSIVPMDLSDSRWINFEKFSTLLGINEKRLKTGFWDHLGIEPLIASRYQIRHCPKCWALGYHCVLFDLSILESCPWHRCALTKPCAGCASAHLLTPHSAYDLINSRFCFQCRTVLPDISHLLSMDPIGSDFASMIIGYCREFIDWWDLVGHKVPDRDVLLEDIIRIGKYDIYQKDYLSWQTGYAMAAVDSIDLAWKLRSWPMKVRHASWTDKSKQSNGLDHPIDNRINKIRDEVGHDYRSLRRQLYKKYVHKHRFCLHSLSCLQREEQFALDGDQICVVSLTYLVWRMSIEGVLLVEGLRYHRKNNFIINLMGPDARYDASIASNLRWCYFGFFAIWHQLAGYCGNRNFRIMMLRSDSDGNFLWKCVTSRERQDDELNKYAVLEFHVLFPDPSELKEMTEQLCRARKKHSGEVFDGDQLLRDEEWAWANLNSNLQDCLFQVRHPNSCNMSGQFQHITV